MQERIQTIKQQALEHLNRDNREGLENLFEISHPTDLGNLLEKLTFEQAVELFAMMPVDKQIEILGIVAPGFAARLLRRIDADEFAHLMQEMHPDDAADIFLTLGKEEQEELLGRIEDDDFRRNLVDLVSYPYDTAGGIMTTEYLAVNENCTVEETIEAAREASDDVEVIYYIYTIDEDQRLSGVLSMRKMLETESHKRVRDIARRDLFKVRVDDDQEESAKIMDRYGLLAVPVVDHQERLRGIITVDDAVHILEQETTEDIYKQAGISPFEEIESERSMKVMNASVWTNLAIRLPWLVIVCIGTLMGAWVMSTYGIYIEKVVELAFFVPVVMAMGGNVGAQSTTIFVRSMVLGQLDLEVFWKTLFTEIFRTGLGIGLFFGLVVGSAIWCWKVYLIGAPLGGETLQLSLSVGSAMFFAILAASANGFLVPWLVHKFGADPATASNPLLTTIQDIVGIMIYFSTAVFFLEQLSI